MPDDPRAIAGKLTDAMRRRLFMLKHSLHSDKCQAFSGHGNAACMGLVEYGLAHRVGDHGLGGVYQITPLGLQVRAILQEEASRG